MKSRAMMALVWAWVVWAPVAWSAGEDAGNQEVQALLRDQVEVQERILSQVVESFKSGLASVSEVAEAERSVLEARVALAREDERTKKGPLDRPIPRVELAPMSLGDVSETLRGYLDGSVNFVLKEGAADLEVPALDLRGTELLTLLNILRDIVPDLGIKVTMGALVVPIDMVPTQMGALGGGMGAGGLGGMDDPFDAPPPPPPMGLPEHATVIFERIPPAPTAPRKTLTVYLGELLERITLEDICTSIETAWELNPGVTQPIFRFHEDTGLLIVAGEVGHMEAVDQVVNQLSLRAVDVRNQAKADLREQLGELEEQLKARYEKEHAKDQENLQRMENEVMRMVELREEASMEVAEVRDELRTVQQTHVEERGRLLEKMEDELRATRERAFLERRELLEQIDELRRVLDAEHQRKLDPAHAQEEHSP